MTAPAHADFVKQVLSVAVSHEGALTFLTVFEAFDASAKSEARALPDAALRQLIGGVSASAVVREGAGSASAFLERLREGMDVFRSAPHLRRQFSSVTDAVHWLAQLPAFGVSAHDFLAAFHTLRAQVSAQRTRFGSRPAS
ncbi:MAG: hypothetical protein RL385_3304 [Pseudomonadota bacterium]|jgi:hypothetical protein